MAFAIQHPIRRNIDEQKVFIENMVKEYPEMIERQIKKAGKGIEAEVESLKDEDPDIREPLVKEFYESIDSTYNLSLDSLFYRSIFLMTYTYFETSIRNIAIECGITTYDSNAFKILQQILKTRSVKLSKETLDIRRRLDKTIRPFRNDLTHNNGNPRSEKVLKRLIKEMPNEIDFYNNFIEIYGPSLILDTLEKEYTLLIELCDDLGFKTRFTGKK